MFIPINLKNCNFLVIGHKSNYILDKPEFVNKFSNSQISLLFDQIISQVSLRFHRKHKL